MILDTDVLFHQINKDLAQCQRALDECQFLPVRGDVIAEQRTLRALKDTVAQVERYWREFCPQSPATLMLKCPKCDRMVSAGCQYCACPFPLPIPLPVESVK